MYVLQFKTVKFCFYLMGKICKKLTEKWCFFTVYVLQFISAASAARPFFTVYISPIIVIPLQQDIAYVLCMHSSCIWSLFLDHMSAEALWDALTQRSTQISQESNTDLSMVIMKFSFSYTKYYFEHFENFNFCFCSSDFEKGCRLADAEGTGPSEAHVRSQTHVPRCSA